MSTCLDDRYELLEVLGSGAAATVWRAHDHQQGVHRALKVLEPDESGPTRPLHARHAAWQRLQREARALGELSHPNIVAVHDVCLGQQAYIVTALCQGGSLRARLDSIGPLGAEASRALGLVLLDALHHAHGRGVVHRDVKPGNVLFDEGRPVLVDFGIAMIERDRSRVTLEGTTLGTFAYMAPEQRLDARDVDARADLYALGATLYECVTGRTPTDLFMADADSPRWWGVPAPLAAVLQRATRYRREHRFPDARAMGLALESVVLEPAEVPKRAAAAMARLQASG